MPLEAGVALIIDDAMTSSSHGFEAPAAWAVRVEVLGVNGRVHRSHAYVVCSGNAEQASQMVLQLVGDKTAQIAHVMQLSSVALDAYKLAPGQVIQIG